ncbi:hypothetical protein ABH926_001603 [Catenulispora sp. GP43]|uniref:hypothetical protein n=1 Tax=Catenulispora sp. GP43 TaxID=3156263 RepID=UPI0035160BBE
MENVGTSPTPEQRKTLDLLVQAGYIAMWKPGEGEDADSAQLYDYDGEGGTATIEYHALGAFVIGYDAGYARWGR